MESSTQTVPPTVAEAKESATHHVLVSQGGEAAPREKANLSAQSMAQLYVVMTVGYLVSTMQGYDGSLMGSINAMEPYHRTFGLNGAGSSTDVVFIIYNIAQITAFPFCGYIADVWGRKACIFIGCLIVLIGTVIQGASHSLGQFIGGRFVLGFGAVVAHAAAPAYTVELAHPDYRGLTAGMYNNFWWIGNILASWTTYGTNLNLTTSWAWRVPTILQAALPSFAMVLILFLPESSRWLVANDRYDEALAILAKYHGEGDAEASIVQLQYKQIVDDHQETDNGRWWDYRELIATRSARYRIGLVVATAFFGQWSGNNVVSYFMPAMIRSAGITSSNTQLLINAINAICCWLASMVGASLIDKFGRRNMMMSGLLGGLVSYILLTAFTAETAGSPNLSYAVIVFIYTFGVAFAMGMTPSATLYPMECLENRTRGKGSAVKFVFLNIATMTNTYGVSVGIRKIGWKLYLVYIVWIAIEIVLIYLFFVETKGKTLEELKEIFESKDPRKANLQKGRIHRDSEVGDKAEE